MTSELLPTKQENPDGLHQRYRIERTDGTPIDPNALYFVLRLDDGAKNKLHSAAGRAAAKEWARVVRSHDFGVLSNVADDLVTLIERLESVPLCNGCDCIEGECNCENCPDNNLKETQ